MTAFPDAWTREEAKRLGALRVFEKPFPIDELREFVRRLAATTPSIGGHSGWISHGLGRV